MPLFSATRLKSFAVLSLAALLPSLPAMAEVVEYKVDYKDGETTLQAHVAKDDALEENRPGVLICHAWWGQGGYARHRARMLAEMGYVAVVLDMYGKGVYTDDAEQAGKLASHFYNNREQFRTRAKAGLEVLKAQPGVDPQRIAVIGYCFGGTTALELAYAGADVAGIVSFHGSLLPPIADSDDAKNIKTKVLICHGQADPFFSNEKLMGVIGPLQKANVPTTTILYSQAMHAFTDPTMDGSLEGAVYQARADRQSWAHMKIFFDEIFAQETDGE